VGRGSYAVPPFLIFLWQARPDCLGFVTLVERSNRECWGKTQLLQGCSYWEAAVKGPCPRGKVSLQKDL